MNTNSEHSTSGPIQYVPGGSAFNNTIGALGGSGSYGYAARSKLRTAGKGNRSNILRRSHTGNKYQPSQVGSAKSYGSKQDGNFLPPTRSAFKPQQVQDSFAAYNKRAKNERFNEEFDTKSLRSASQVSAANLKKAFGVGGDRKAYINKSIASHQSVFSRHSRPKSSGNVCMSMRSGMGSAAAEVHKKRILEVVDQLNEDELEKVSEMLKAQDILPHVPQAQPDGEVQLDEDLAEPVHAEEVAEPSIAQDERDEVLTSVSKAAPSQGSRFTSKTFISQLQSQLNEERQARLQLEQELQQLKQISHDIHSHLKLKNHKWMINWTEWKKKVV